MENKQFLKLSKSIQNGLAKADWNTKTKKKCKHCKKQLCKFEYLVNKSEWNKHFHHHWCCYVCFQEKHN